MLKEKKPKKVKYKAVIIGASRDKFINAVKAELPATLEMN